MVPAWYLSFSFLPEPLLPTYWQMLATACLTWLMVVLRAASFLEAMAREKYWRDLLIQRVSTEVTNLLKGSDCLDWHSTASLVANIVLNKLLYFTFCLN